MGVWIFLNEGKILVLLGLNLSLWSQIFPGLFAPSQCGGTHRAILFLCPHSFPIKKINKKVKTSKNRESVSKQLSPSGDGERRRRSSSVGWGENFWRSQRGEGGREEQEKRGESTGSIQEPRGTKISPFHHPDSGRACETAQKAIPAPRAKSGREVTAARAR